MREKGLTGLIDPAGNRPFLGVREDALEMASPPVSIEDVYRQHAPRLWRSLVAHTTSPEIATEAVAEAFAQALARGDALMDPAAWVWKTSFRIAAGEMARRAPSATYADRAATETGYERVEEADALVRVFARLPPRQRAVVVLRYYAEMPLRDIAATLSIALPTVGVHLTQARRRLRDLLVRPMSDLKTRFRTLDRLEMPNIWDEVQRREPRPEMVVAPRPIRRLAIAAIALLVAAAGVALAVRALGGNRGPTPATPSPTIGPFATQNGLIAFTWSEAGSPSQIYTADADGSDVTEITHMPFGVNDPTWSPDGSRIAFAGQGDIYIANADGTDPRRLTTATDNDSYSNPSWSPDGTTIAAEKIRGPGHRRVDIVLLAIDGSGETPLTQPGSPRPLNVGPAWSPDGTRIAFLALAQIYGTSSGTDIYVMNADGSTRGISAYSACSSPFRRGRQTASRSRSRGSI